jgi:small subunit ribosomal protein S9
MAKTKTETAEAKPAADTSAKKGPDKGGFYWGVGRRKSSVARVRIKPGDGKLLVNKRQLKDYFAREQDRKAIVAPLKAVEAEKLFDVFANVRGGGNTGQTGAVVLGIARALRNYDYEKYTQPLREGGYLTAEWSREKRPDKAVQEGDSSSRNVNLHYFISMITMAAGNESQRLFFCKFGFCSVKYVLYKDKSSNMSPALMVENISSFGIWLFVKGKEYFLNFGDEPYFKDQTIGPVW